MADEPPEWPWPRLLLLSLGSGLAMVGAYVLMYTMFAMGFEISNNLTDKPFLWGGFALVVGIIMLGAPWFPNAPWWRNSQ